jgi:protease IV
MRLAGKVWRLLVGIKDGLVLILMLLFFGGLYALLSASPNVGRVQTGALLLELNGPIVEQSSEASPMDLATGGSLPREYQLRDLVHGLKQAAQDKRVEAVALDLDVFAGGGRAAVANVADALDEVRRAGKPVIAYATAYTDESYMLAAHASEVWLHPFGGVAITGPGGSNLYYAGLLDKLGVTANVYRVGTYKAAVEPYTRADMSPEAREAMEALAASLWETWLVDVRQARPKAQVAEYVAAPADRIAASGGDMAQAALAAGLVDRIGDRTAFGRRVAEIVGEEHKDVPGSFRHSPFEAWAEANPVGEGRGEIGVLTIAGTIIDGQSQLGMAGGDTIAENLREGMKNNRLKALVIRVNTPGGSVTGSEQIRGAVLEAKEAGLPVVISMGSVAASGGYWVAAAGDHIMAEPSTITGSIGVFGILPSFEGALEKLGIGADGIKTTPLSGEPDLLRGPSPEADRLLQMGVETTYRRFIGLVSEARKIPPQRVDEIAQGRVWAGGTARQLGLIDSFGSLDDAVAEAARRANLDPEDAKPVFLEPEPSFLTRILRTRTRSEEPVARDPFSRLAARPQVLLAQALGDAQQVLSGPAIQARCLECPGASPARQSSERLSLLGWLARLIGA